jgi:hypothetical protein
MPDRCCRGVLLFCRHFLQFNTADIAKVLIIFNMKVWCENCLIDVFPPMVFKMKIKLLSVAVSILIALSSSQASAVCPGSSGPSAISSVSPNGDGSFKYQVSASGGYLGCGTLPVSETPGFMTDFYLPYFDDMGIRDVTVVADVFSGINWNYTLEASNDMFHLGGGSMHFYTNYRPTGTSYNSLNIAFNAAYGEVKGPFYQNVQDPLTGLSRGYLGDPGLPGSPKLIAALDAAAGDIPEPSTIALAALGAFALFALRRKSR